MANQFPKEIMVAWEKLLLGFEDMHVLSMAVEVAENRSAESQQRTNDTVWKPMPYIMNSFDGSDQSSNFQDSNGLTVPCRVNTRKSVPWTFTDYDLRDSMQMQRVITAAGQRLASDINKKVNDVVFNSGTVVIAKSTAASGYDDVALIDSAFNTRGVGSMDRFLALNSTDYNAMASNLALRETMDPQNVTKAFRQAYLGNVAGFETLKLDYGNSIAAAAGASVVINGANQYYTPSSTTTVAGEQINNDNRYQTIAITVGGGTVAVGDCFTITGVNSVHNIAKTDTGNLQTFRIVEIVTGGGGTGTVKISPAIISNGGGTDIEAQYKNVTATPANGATLTFLNTTARQGNVFWKKESIELTPGIIMPESAGIDALTYTSPQGIQLVLQKQGDVSTSTGKYRLDTYFGVTNKNPEMNGLLLFGQV